MPSTSVHLPDELLRGLDRTAKRRRMSRNRLIIEACRSIIGQGQAEWPEGFFARERMSPRDLELLRSEFETWTRELRAARHSKREPPF